MVTYRVSYHYFDGGVWQDSGRQFITQTEAEEYIEWLSADPGAVRSSGVDMFRIEKHSIEYMERKML